MDPGSTRWTSRPAVTGKARSSSVTVLQPLAATQQSRASANLIAQPAPLGLHAPLELEPQAEAAALRTAFLAYSRLPQQTGSQQPSSSSTQPQSPGMSMNQPAAPSSRTPTFDGSGPGGASVGGSGPGGAGMGISQWMRLCTDLGLPDSLGGPLPGTVLQTIHSAYRPHQSARLHYLGFVQAVAALSSQLKYDLLGAVGRHGAALLEFQRHQWKLQLLQQQLQLQLQQQQGQQQQGPGYMAPRGGGMRASRSSSTGTGEDPADAALDLTPQDEAKELDVVQQLKETINRRTRSGGEGGGTSATAAAAAAAAAVGWMPREPPPLPPPIMLPGELPTQPPHAMNPAYAYIASGLGGLYGVYGGGSSAAAAAAAGGGGRVVGARGNGRSPQRQQAQAAQQQQQMGNWVRSSAEAPPAAAGAAAGGAAAVGTPYLQEVHRNKPYAPQLRPLRYMPAGDPPDPGVPAADPAPADDPDPHSSPLSNAPPNAVRGADGSLGFPLSSSGLGIRSLVGIGSPVAAASPVRAAAAASRVSGVVPSADPALQVRLPAVSGATRLGAGGAPEPPGLSRVSLTSYDSGGSNGSGGGGGGGGVYGVAAPSGCSAGEVDTGILAALMARLERLERSAVSQESRLARVGSRVHGLEVAAAQQQQQQQKAAAAAAAAAAKAAEEGPYLASVAEQARSELEGKQRALEQQLLQQQSLLLNALATAQAAREDAAAATAAAVQADASAAAVKAAAEEAMSALPPPPAASAAPSGRLSSAGLAEVSQRLLKPFRAEVDEELQMWAQDQRRTDENMDEQLRFLAEQQRQLDGQVAALAEQQQRLASEVARVAADAARVAAEAAASATPDGPPTASLTTPGGAGALNAAGGSSAVGGDSAVVVELAAGLRQLREQVRALHAAQGSAAALAAAAAAAAASSAASRNPSGLGTSGGEGYSKCEYASLEALQEAEAAWGKALQTQKEALEERLTKALRDAGASAAAAAAAAVAAAGMASHGPGTAALAALHGPVTAAAAAPLLGRLADVEGTVGDLAERMQRLSKRQDEAEAVAAASAAVAALRQPTEPIAALRLEVLSERAHEKYEQLNAQLEELKLQLEGMQQQLDSREVTAAPASATAAAPASTTGSTGLPADGSGDATAQPRTRTPSPPRPEQPLARQPSSPTAADAPTDASAAASCTAAAPDALPAELQRRLETLTSEVRQSVDTLSSSISNQLEQSRTEVTLMVAREVSKQLAAAAAVSPLLGPSTSGPADGSTSGGGGALVRALQDRLTALESEVADAARDLVDVCAASDMTTESMELCTKHMQVLDQGQRELQKQLDELRNQQKTGTPTNPSAEGSDPDRRLGLGGGSGLAELRNQLSSLQAHDLPGRLEAAEAALRKLQDGSLAAIAAAAAAGRAAAPPAAGGGPDMEMLRQVLLELSSRLDALATQVSEQEHGLDVLAGAAETASSISRSAASRLDVVEASLAGGGGGGGAGRFGLAAAASRGALAAAPGVAEAVEARLAAVEKGAAVQSGAVTSLSRQLDDVVRRVGALDSRVAEAAMDAAAARAAAAVAAPGSGPAAPDGGRRANGGTGGGGEGVGVPPPGECEESPDSYGVTDIGGGGARVSRVDGAQVERMKQEWEARLKTAVKLLETRMQSDREKAGADVAELQRGVAKLREKGAMMDEVAVKLSRRLDSLSSRVHSMLEAEQAETMTTYSTIGREQLGSHLLTAAASRPASRPQQQPQPRMPLARSLSAGSDYQAGVEAPPDGPASNVASRVNSLAARFLAGSDS